MARSTRDYAEGSLIYFDEVLADAVVVRDLGTVRISSRPTGGSGAHTTFAVLGHTDVAFFKDGKWHVMFVGSMTTAQGDDLATMLSIWTQAKESAYAPEIDSKGRELHPGDRVRFKIHPRGSAEGTVVISSRARVVMKDRSTRPALVIDTGDRIYSMPSPKSVTKIMKTKPNPSRIEILARRLAEGE